MKKFLKSIVSSVMALCVALCVCSCGTVKLDWKLSSADEDVCLHTFEQSVYLASDYSKIDLYASGQEELSRPRPVSLTWSVSDKGKAVSDAKYSVEISENMNFAGSVVYDAENGSAEIYNLRVGTTYFWRVRADLGKGKGSISSAAAFTTEDVAPRNLYIDGITNVRDLGGWHTPTGRVRQGMIYRCGRLNKSEQPTVEIEITQEGIEVMREQLGIVSEIDLRMPDKHDTETGGITQSPLGSDVEYKNIPMDWVMSSSFNYLSDPKYYPAIKEMFAFLADESRYPLIYHCNIGTDRTGLYAFLINGLLGVSEQDLYRDYLFSNFGKIGGSRSIKNIQAYVDRAKSFPGNTLAEKIENCLLGIGVPQSDINAVKAIMTE